MSLPAASLRFAANSCGSSGAVELCSQADSIAVNHLAEVERRIASLQALKTELTRMVDECGHGRVCDCRIIEALADHSLCVTVHAH